MIPDTSLTLNSDISSALQVLEKIHETIEATSDEKLKAVTKDDLNLLISTLQNPILRSIATIQGSLSELDAQLQEHPSILPADFCITESGELELNVQRSVYESDYQTLSQEFDDQRVPVIKLSSSSGEPSSPQLNNSASDKLSSLPPITTPSYVLEFQKVIEETSHGREVITIQLYKPDGNSLGFSVVGLRTEEKGEIGIFIQEIQPNGIAGRDGRLREGDQILAIDGQPLDTNVSHQQAIAILQQARGVVELVVARPVELSETHSPSPSALSDTSKTGSDMVLTSDWAQVEVIELINDGSGLGFGIVGGKSTGVVVKTILPGGVADRNGRLQSGDHILQIGDVNLRGMGSEQVAAVLRQSGSNVRIVVARPVESGNPDYHQNLEFSAPIVPSSVLADPEELNKYFMSHGYPEISPTPPRSANVLDDYTFCNGSNSNLNVNDSSLMHEVPITLPILTMDMIPPESLVHLPEMEKFNVELKKDTHGLGITIAGYVCEKEELSGIFIKSISEGSAADLCNKIQVNDRIVEVDGKSLQGLTNHEAVELLRSTGQVVNLSLERYLRGPKYEQLQLAIANSEAKPQSQSQLSPSIISLPRFPIITDGESTVMVDVDGEETRTTVDSSLFLDIASDEINLEFLIDCNYEGPLKPTVDAALQRKWSNILGPGYEIIVSQVSKFSDTGGLGISLEGTVDVVNGKEIRPHHYIRSILPEGPIGKHTQLRPGDELLEVNGCRLLDMNHSEVVRTLKELPKHFRLVCSRNLELLPIQVIDTAQEKSAFATRSILGGSLNNLIPATDRLVKAKSDGSLASTGTINTDTSLSKLKSRSLEPLTGLAMWSSDPQIIELVKGERGLGFSILDYQDPMNPSETVIVIRSLVPGGVAQLDGRLIPGDRLLSVNDTILENASLDQAVQVLKGAPKGIVRIGVAKPLPIADSLNSNQVLKLKQKNKDGAMIADNHSTADSTADDENSMYSCAESLSRSPEVKCSKPNVEKLSLENVEESFEIEKEDVIDENIKSLPLPAALEREIKIQKGCKQLGISVECTGDENNGVIVTEVSDGGAFDHEGSVRVGDFLLSINNESLRRCTQSQARSILKRTQLLSTDITVIFISRKDAFRYWKSLKKCNITPLPPPHISSQISPSSPYINSDVATIKEKKTTDSKDTREINTIEVPSIKNQNFARSKRVFKSENLVVLGSSWSNIPTTPINQITSLSFDVLASTNLLDVDSPVLSSKNSEEGDNVDVDNENTRTKRVHSTAYITSSNSSGDLLSVRGDKAKSDDNILNYAKCISLSESSLCVASKCSSARDIFSVSHDSDSIDFLHKSRENISQSEFSSKSDSDVSDHRISLPEDELLEEEIRELGRLSKLHRLGSVDLESYHSEYRQPVTQQYEKHLHRDHHIPQLQKYHRNSSFLCSASSCDQLKKLQRFASTGVELGNEEPDMILENNVESSSLLSKHWGPERCVEVPRDENNSLGISIVGGKVDLYNSNKESRCAISGIFIKNVIPESPAGKSGELKTGDRIIKVNGVDLRSATHEIAVQAIKSSGSPVTFIVQSLIQWSTDVTADHESTLKKTMIDDDVCTHDVIVGTNSTGTPTSEAQKLISSSSVTSIQDNKTEAMSVEKRSSLFEGHSVLQKISEGECGENNTIEEVAEKRVRTRAGRLIMRSSAGSLKRHEYDSMSEAEDDEDEFGYTLNKVKKKYGHLGNDVLLVELEKDSHGLGLSLAGHKDRNKMAVFVCGINPNGAAYKKGNIRVGDEILEINGHVVQGRCHLNASAIIKGLPGPVFKLIIFRVPEGIHDDLAVKPITQFPVTLEEESPEEKYANFKGIRIISLKKTLPPAENHNTNTTLPQSAQGLGIMIIEGKHSEVGHGIFISDIQEGSVADQAGLLVGDMILSVNKDSLVGSSYDSAVHLLKQTEGIITMVVCNPKRESQINQATTSKDSDKQMQTNVTTTATTPTTSPSTTTSATDSSAAVAEPSTAEENQQRESSDPTVAPIIAGRECYIEIPKDNVALGINIVGGCDTPFGIVMVHEVYEGGAAAMDGRLRKGDQILEVNSVDYGNIPFETAFNTLRQCLRKACLVVYRHEALADPNAITEEVLYDVFDVELTRKRGKGFGMAIVEHKSGRGLYISRLYSGGTAIADGRLIRGDQILSVNGQDLRNADSNEGSLHIRLSFGKVTFRVGRLKVRPCPPNSVSEKVEPIPDSVRRVITLGRMETGFGFTFAGGCGSPEGNVPLYIDCVYEKSFHTFLHEGDRLLTIEGVKVEGFTLEQALALFNKVSDEITISVLSSFI